MDAQHFDDFLRSLTAAAPRRGLLAGLTSGLLAIVPLVLGGEEAATKRKKRKKKKKKKKKKQQCIPPCSGGKNCVDRQCICPSSQKDCQGTCIPESVCCGGCGAGQICVQGQCVTGQGTCQAGDNICANTGTFGCNGGTDCYCTRSATNELRCGYVIGSFPCGCTTDLECQQAMGAPGAYCVANAGLGPCAALCSGANICAIPCQI